MAYGFFHPLGVPAILENAVADNIQPVLQNDQIIGTYLVQLSATGAVQSRKDHPRIATQRIIVHDHPRIIFECNPESTETGRIGKAEGGFRKGSCLFVLRDGGCRFQGLADRVLRAVANQSHLCTDILFIQEFKGRNRFQLRITVCRLDRDRWLLPFRFERHSGKRIPMMMIRQHGPGGPTFRLLLDRRTELGGYRRNRNETDSASSEPLLHTRTEISHHNVTFDKRITQKGDTHRAVRLPAIS